MEYKGIHYQVVQTATRVPRFKWIVHVAPNRTRTGVSYSMKSAIREAKTKIEKLLKQKKAE